MLREYWLLIGENSRVSCHTWGFGHLLENKFALGWWNGQHVPILLQKRTAILYFPQQIFWQPTTTWIVARQVWTWLVKCATSLFNQLCSNVAKQVAGFFLFPVLPLLIKSRLFQSDANLYYIFDPTVACTATIMVCLESSMVRSIERWLPVVA